MTDDDQNSYKGKQSAVPNSRFSRFARLGSLAGGVAGGMLAEGARQLAEGKRPRAQDMLLTPGNTRRVADQLAQLRGAAMKVGQVLSMDAGDLLPAELADMLAQLRSQASSMPMSQLVQVLESNWGKGWNKQFSQFSFEPLAAASIGQVHSAKTKDGRQLALKIQYPGVRDSIDSDVANVATLLRLSGLLPKGIDMQPLLEEARQQLHQEADYELEAQWLQRYGELLADDPDIILPAVHSDLTTADILAMTYVTGTPVEAMQQAPQDERNRIAQLLLDLFFRELFEFQMVQTDPNFANYLYDSQNKQLVLLDFGATRTYPDTIVNAYQQLLQAAQDNDRDGITEAATQIGFFQDYIKPEQQEAVLDLFTLATDPLRYDGAYDFGHSTLAEKIRSGGMSLSMEQDYWHTPPADALFLHRKLAGLYLLFARLGVQLDVAALFRPYRQ